MFQAAEKHALSRCRADPFVLVTWARAKIGPDIHARVGKVLYSVPWRHIGKTADVRVTGTMVQFFIGGELVKTHPRKAWGKQTDFGDYPPEKIAFHMRTPAWCRTQAGDIGPACEQVIAELLADNALYRLRAAQGVVGMADRHDPSRLEAACAKAIAAGDPSYRTIKGILAAGTDRDLPVAAAAGDGGAGAFLHGPRRSPTSWPCPARSPATSWTCTPRAAARKHGHDPPGHGHRPHRPGQALRTLKLSGMLATLDARLAQAAAGDLGHLDFLQVLCEDEISRRASVSLAKRIRRARFEEQATLEGFDFAAAPKLPAAQIRDLAALRWLHAGESVILYGPVGVGKTHIAQALGHLAIRSGAETRFLKTSRRPGPPGRRPRRPHLGQAAPRAHPPRRPHPGRLRHARADRRPSRRPLRTDHRAGRPTRYPDLQPGTRRLVPAVPQPGRRRVPPRPAHQHQPPGLHERAQLPAQQKTRPRRPHHQGGHQVKQAKARTWGIT